MTFNSDEKRRILEHVELAACNSQMLEEVLRELRDTNDLLRRLIAVVMEADHEAD